MRVMVEYSDAFKRRMVERMAAPHAVSASRLSVEVGVAQSTLSKWLLQAGSLDGVVNAKKPRTSSANAPPAGHAPVTAWSAETKVAVVLEAAAIPEEQLGEWLRRKGLHDDDLKRLRDEVRDAAVASLSTPRGMTPEQRRIKELERELRRSTDALAETAARLVLRKKAAALWGEEGDDT